MTAITDVKGYRQSDGTCNVSRTVGGADGRDGSRSSSVKDVAALAGVSLGTVSNVLNRPHAGQRQHPGPGRAGDGRARLRAQRVGATAPGRNQPHAGLRHARRRQPVLHRRRPGHRGRRRGRRPVGGAVQQRSAHRARGRAPRPAPAAAGAGHPRHPGRRGRGDARRGAPPGHATGDRRPHPHRPVLLLGLGRRPPRVVALRSSTSSTVGTDGWPSSAARVTSGRCATDSKVPATPGPTQGSRPKTWCCSRPSRSTWRAAARPAPDSPDCPPAGARPPRSAATT